MDRIARGKKEFACPLFEKTGAAFFSRFFPNPNEFGRKITDFCGFVPLIPNSEGRATARFFPAFRTIAGMRKISAIFEKVNRSEKSEKSCNWGGRGFIFGRILVLCHRLSNLPRVAYTF